jgi:hypothetical protein
MSALAWRKIAAGARGEEREHPDLYLNRHRAMFSIVYHDPPPQVYYRHPQRMRLEVDWPEDLALIRAIAERGPGMLAPLEEVIRWLDRHDDVAALNRGRVEKTGPVVSYSPDLQRDWYKLAQGQPIYTWDNDWVAPSNYGSGPLANNINCETCGALLGWGIDGKIELRETGTLVEAGRVKCGNCKAVRVWRRHGK